MHRSTIRSVAIVILALFGAPVALHVVMHDLHAHHDARALAYEGESGHHDHEHPIVSSPAPQVPSLAGVAQPIAAAPSAMPAKWTCVVRAQRSVIALGALRTDTDVGLQPLLSIFLI